jgi:hypothetical protein
VFALTSEKEALEQYVTQLAEVPSPPPFSISFPIQSPHVFVLMRRH